MTALTTGATDIVSGGTPTWRVGDVIDDRYRVVRVHEDGAMGLVFAVRHLLWGIDLAVKSPRPDMFATAAARERFVTEAETWVSLGLHPNVCACHYVRVFDGVPRVFAEYVPGGSLRHWIDDGRLYRGGPAEALTRMLDIAIQVAWGLDHAHTRHLVHLDVKPSNVLIDADGTAKVTDFGLARAKAAATRVAAPDGPSHVSVLVTGGGGMTRAYASPEQAEGRPVGRRGDVFSFAVSVLDMFNGGVTWRSGAAAGAALQELVHRDGPPVRIPAMPPALSELLAGCLAADPARRPASMADVVEQLAAVHHAATGSPYPRAKPVAADLRADEYNNRALSLLDLGRAADADAAFGRALAADPQHLAATYNAGTVRWRRGEFSDVELITRLEAMPSGTWQAWCLLAQTHMERGDLASARELLDGVAPKDRREPEVRAAREAIASGRARQVGASTLTSTGSGYLARTDVSGASLLHRDAYGKLCHRDVASGARTSLRHPGRVETLDVTPDGRFGVSADDRLRLWDLGTGRCLRSAGLRRYRPGAGFSRRVRVSADARKVVYVDVDGVARVWEPFGGRWKRRVPLRGDAIPAVSHIAVSADGSRAVTGGSRPDDPETVRLWDLETGECTETLRHSYVRYLSFTPDGRTVVIGGLSGSIELWNPGDGAGARTLSRTGWDGGELAVSDDGRLLFEAGDTFSRLWELGTGRCVRTFDGPRRGYSRDARFSPDGRSVHTVSDIAGLERWDLANPYTGALQLCRPRPHARVNLLYAEAEGLVLEAEAALAAGSHAVALGLLTRARSVEGHERSPRVLSVWRELERHTDRVGVRAAWTAAPTDFGDVSAISLSDHDGLALLGGPGGQVRVWDIEGARVLRSLDGGARTHAVCLSADGRLALSAHGAGTVRLWDVASGECLRVLPGDRNDVRELRFLSRDSALVDQEDGTVLVWDLVTGEERHTLRQSHWWLNVSEDGVDRVRLAASAGPARVGSVRSWLRLFDTGTGRWIRLWDGHDDAVTSVSVNGDRSLLLSSAADGTVRMWSTRTGRLMRRFATGPGRVNAARFTAGWSYAVTGGADAAVRVWNIWTGACVHVLEGHRTEVLDVRSTSDGRYVLSHSRDHTARLWELDWELAVPE
ncbi:protein kinase domain-containing protein [Phytomonospora endophytica]|uniref:WD40 repeat protein n=1 Tax=Phytomonospora endophytica TaxID=714109 RepID=A0A841FHC4_9ACTN|nr:protein kinase [Phytomonospora endophytica]MBB6034383.1 WD40 repeat protein [Phytomonospora endophytica]GIG66776.1 hypothetical protein Pen01_30710 [Phytomonospora endophytica]